MRPGNSREVSHEAPVAAAVPLLSQSLRSFPESESAESHQSQNLRSLPESVFLIICCISVRVCVPIQRDRPVGAHQSFFDISHMLRIARLGRRKRAARLYRAIRQHQRRRSAPGALPARRCPTILLASRMSRLGRLRSRGGGKTRMNSSWPSFTFRKPISSTTRSIGRRSVSLGATTFCAVWSLGRWRFDVPVGIRLLTMRGPTSNRWDIGR